MTRVSPAASRASYCARRVTGDANLAYAGGAALAALTCLASVGGDLSVEHNDALTSLSGLGALSTVCGNLTLAATPRS